MQYENLILDDDIIMSLTEVDKAFLEKFTNLQRLSMNATKLKSLGNFPSAKLIKVSAENI